MISDLLHSFVSLLLRRRVCLSVPLCLPRPIANLENLRLGGCHFRKPKNPAADAQFACMLRTRKLARRGQQPKNKGLPGRDKSFAALQCVI